MNLRKNMVKYLAGTLVGALLLMHISAPFLAEDAFLFIEETQGQRANKGIEQLTQRGTWGTILATTQGETLQALRLSPGEEETTSYPEDKTQPEKIDQPEVENQEILEETQDLQEELPSTPLPQEEQGEEEEKTELEEESEQEKIDEILPQVEEEKEPLEEETPEEETPDEETLEEETPEEELIPPLLPEGAVIVYTYGQLAQALGQNNGITQVYIGGPITQSKGDGAITIHPDKGQVTLGGLVPGGAEKAQFVQSSSGENEVFRLPGGLRGLVIEDLIIKSQSPYPFITGTAFGGTLTLKRSAYTGVAFAQGIDPGQQQHQGSTLNIIASQPSPLPAPEEGEGETPSLTGEEPDETDEGQKTEEPDKKEETEGTGELDETDETDETDEIDGIDEPGESEEEQFLFARAFEAVDSQTVVVRTHSELKEALSQDNGYTYIYLGNDITQTAGDTGIVIHPAKTHVVIDGIAPGASVPAIYTQYAAADIARTINITASNTSTKSVTVRNMYIGGYNYYGFIGVYEATGVSPDLIYENVTYGGPQITFAPNSSVHYINCDINLKSQGQTVNEVAEASHIRFSGKVAVYVTATSAALSLFWMKRGGGTFTLSPGADVTIATPGYLMYTATAPYPVITLEEGSRLAYTGGQYGFQYAAQRVGEVIVKTGATLDLQQTTSNYAYGMLSIEKGLTLDPGSTLLINKGAGGQGLLFPLAGGNVTFNNPRRVIISAATKQLFSFTGAAKMNIATDAVNLWPTAAYAPSSIEDGPKYIWNKKQMEPLTLAATYNGNTLQSLSHNLTGDDPTENLTTATFAIASTNSNQVMTLGSFTLQTDPVYHSGEGINGNVEGGAQVKAQYPTLGGSLTTQGSAQGNRFSLGVTQEMTIGGEVMVTAFSNSLNKVEKVAVLEGGMSVLALQYVPASAAFGTHPVSEEEKTFYLINTEDFYVDIEDTRQGQNWTLSISAGALTTAAGKALPGTLVFIDEKGNTPLTNTPVIVARGSGSTKVQWAQNQGLALMVRPGQVLSETYAAPVVWHLEGE